MLAKRTIFLIIVIALLFSDTVYSFSSTNLRVRLDDPRDDERLIKAQRETFLIVYGLKRFLSREEAEAYLATAEEIPVVPSGRILVFLFTNILTNLEVAILEEMRSISIFILMILENVFKETGMILVLIYSNMQKIEDMDTLRERA